jgi:2-polyprenyl-6-methoxyphenol hydroxylase-like FAD-dependent oxidoreductase
MRAGAVRVNTFATDPGMTGPLLPGDERFDAVTARRPVLEAAATRLAVAAKVRIRWGVATLGLLTTQEAGVTRVTGVATTAGPVTGDLVVDCTGRRSQLPRWLPAAGVGGLVEETADRGFTYYSRYFRFTDDEQREQSTKYRMLDVFGSLSMLRVLGDNNTWSLCFVARSDDHDLRELRHEPAWTAAAKLIPSLEPWLRAAPLTGGVQVMAGLKDRWRNLYESVRIGRPPLVTGLVAIGDAWAATNPTVGPGLAMTLQHSVLLRDALRATGATDAVALAEQFGKATNDELDGTYRSTALYSRHRLAEMDADDVGELYVRPDWTSRRALELLAARDVDALRVIRAMAQMLPDASKGLDEPATAGMLNVVSLAKADAGAHRKPPTVADVVARLMPEAERTPLPGPTRRELLRAVGR